MRVDQENPAAPLEDAGAAGSALAQRANRGPEGGRLGLEEDAVSVLLKQVHLELHTHRTADVRTGVLYEHRKFDGVENRLEVCAQLGLRQSAGNRRQGHRCRRPSLFGGAGVKNRLAGALGADVDDDRTPSGGELHEFGRQPKTLFPGKPQQVGNQGEAESVRTESEDVVDLPLQCGKVDRQVGIVGHADDRQDAAEPLPGHAILPAARTASCRCCSMPALAAAMNRGNLARLM